MISKEQIQATVVSYWSAENGCFVAESSLIPHVVLGVGQTPEEALQNFGESLEDSYEDIMNDNVAGYKTGRPAKGYVSFNVNLRPSSRVKVTELANKLRISYGEAVDHLVFFYECKIQEVEHVPQKDELVKAMNQFAENMQQGFSQMMNQMNQLNQMQNMTRPPRLEPTMNFPAMLSQFQQGLSGTTTVNFVIVNVQPQYPLIEASPGSTLQEIPMSTGTVLPLRTGVKNELTAI